MMSQASIPVDPTNFGQVLACIGFVEAAQHIFGRAEGGFDWSRGKTTRFHLRAMTGPVNPFRAVLKSLVNAKVCALIPPNSSLTIKNICMKTSKGDYPFPAPSKPATCPALLEVGQGSPLMVTYWGDATIRDNLKFWAGVGGYSGAELLQDAIGLLQKRANNEGDLDHAVSDPFTLSAPMSSSFRFDWRRDYIPLDAGFSLNSHRRKMTPIGYPLVEVLAAIGAENTRPEFHSKLKYRYGIIGSPNTTVFFPLVFLRPALGCAQLPFATRTFRMELGWPGQKGQARCITNVTEEFQP